MVNCMLCMFYHNNNRKTMAALTKRNPACQNPACQLRATASVHELMFLGGVISSGYLGIQADGLLTP